jgi:hypothetical protein
MTPTFTERRKGEGIEASVSVSFEHNGEKLISTYATYYTTLTEVPSDFREIATQKIAKAITEYKRSNATSRSSKTSSAI